MCMAAVAVVAAAVAAVETALAFAVRRRARRVEISKGLCWIIDVQHATALCPIGTQGISRVGQQAKVAAAHFHSCGQLQRLLKVVACCASS
jgi:hypothetical protein